MPSWHCRRISRAPVRGRERPRDLGLAHAGLALEQQRLLEHHGQVDGQRERPVGQISLGGERGARRLDGIDLASGDSRLVAQR